MNVLERDEVTIRDVIALQVGRPRTDSRGRPITTPRTYSTNRAFPAGAEVWSYGSHFPLFRYVRPNGNRGPRTPFYLVNGDRWPGGRNRSRTSAHQDIARRAILETGLPFMVIPFTALSGAGIELDSVRPIHSRPDSVWTERRYADVLEDVPRWARIADWKTETRYGATFEDVPRDRRSTYRELTDEERSALESAGAYAPNGWGYRPILPDEDGRYSWNERYSVPIERDEDGRYSWEITIHRLGDAVFSAVREIVEPRRPAIPFERSRDTARERVQLTADGMLYCEPSDGAGHEAGPGSACVHCGEELQAQTVVWRRRARYLSSFDTNEVPPLYFLAELPRGAGDTVEEAIDALAPRAVHASLARGVDVRRQGDVFYIATDLSDEELAARGIRSRARLTMWTRGARPRKGETGYSEPLSAKDRRELSRIARATWRRRDVQAQAPHSEPGIRRRFATLRAKHVAEIADARDRLRRATFADTRPGYVRTTRVQAVTMARRRLESLLAQGVSDSLGNRSPAMARDSYRRQAWTALEEWEAARRAAHARLRPELFGDRLERTSRDIRRAVSIYGTAHTATEAVTLRNGATYARGIARHVPGLEVGRFGRPDHSPVKLGDGTRWYLAIRNTVPRQASQRRRRAPNHSSPIGENRGRRNPADS